MNYPDQYGAVSGNRIEFKVHIKDMDSTLLNMNVTVRLHDRAEEGDDWTATIDFN